MSTRMVEGGYVMADAYPNEKGLTLEDWKARAEELEIHLAAADESLRLHDTQLAEARRVANMFSAVLAQIAAGECFADPAATARDVLNEVERLPLKACSTRSTGVPERKDGSDHGEVATPTPIAATEPARAAMTQSVADGEDPRGWTGWTRTTPPDAATCGHRAEFLIILPDGYRCAACCVRLVYDLRSALTAKTEEVRRLKNINDLSSEMFMEIRRVCEEGAGVRADYVDDCVRRVLGKIRQAESDLKAAREELRVHRNALTRVCSDHGRDMDYELRRVQP